MLVPGQNITMSVPLTVHDGAALTSVTVNWIVTTLHNPNTLPKFRVLATLTDGTTVAVSSPATGADAEGYFSPPATSASGWYNNGQARSLTIPVDGGPLGMTYGNSATPQLQVDVSNVTYSLEIQEEQGVTGFPFSAVVYAQNANLVAITNVVPIGDTTTVDGVVAAFPLVVLLTNQDDPTQNGLWNASAASSVAWKRYPVSFAGGAIFHALGGGTLDNTYWQSGPADGIQGLPLWIGSQAIPAGTQWAPIHGGNGLTAVATTGGTTSTLEPAWPAVPGQTVGDGSVTWTMQSNPCAAPTIVQMLDPKQLNTGCGAGFATFGNIWLPVACHFEQIMDCRFE